MDYNKKNTTFVYTIDLIMLIKEVSIREFRSNQKDVLEAVDKGEKVILRRGRKKAYIITPISEEDLYFTPQIMEQIERSLQAAKEGRVTKISSEDELQSFADSL